MILTYYPNTDTLDGTFRSSEMSPQNTPHAVAVRLVHEALRPIFPEDRYLVHDQLPLALGPDSEPEPDVSVVEMAEAPLQFDQSRKRDLYARHALPEYWIVNLVDRQLEGHRAPTGDSYTEVTVHSTDETVSLRDQSIAVADLVP